MNKFKISVSNDQQTWKKLILSRPEANFLQSYNWAQFQKKIGKQVWPLLLNQDGQAVAAALTIKEEAKRGNYLTIAGGPLLDWHQDQTQANLKKLLSYLKHLAKQEDCWFIRIRPQIKDTRANRFLVKKLGLKEAPMHLTADLTINLDLEPTEEELLKNMRKNTRYYIRRAKRDGITVKTFKDPAKIQEFYDYQLYLAKKHNFVPFSYKFLHEQFKTFVKDDQALLFNSYLDDELLASAFIIFYNQEAVYHYGISTPKNEKLPGSYAVLWAAIQAAKKRDCQRFNFWGIAPEDEPEHRFAGVSLFKRGFGGKEWAYLPAHDLVVHPFYWVTRIFEELRRRIRKL